jgi:hypothetical protein
MAGRRPDTPGTITSQAVRVSSAAYAVLQEMAAESGMPIVRCLDDLVQEAYRRRLWSRFAEANRLVEDDPAALAAVETEDAIWSAADTDGLDPDDGIAWDESLEDAASW